MNYFLVINNIQIYSFNNLYYIIDIYHYLQFNNEAILIHNLNYFNLMKILFYI